ncbi:hypothetical protein [Streptomyces phytophilus]|uniref:hypothetical protein n=1 Tax=Streptomyces phytophilus TaxID=722715 RepID=UPI0015F11104|nr:hypothetical protein [Streptomyces phytophilus]
MDAVQFDPGQPGYIDAVITDVAVEFSVLTCVGKATGDLPIAYSRRNAPITAKPEVSNPTGAAVTVSEAETNCGNIVEPGDEVARVADYDVVWNPVSR